jgi:hypothetical protein
LERQEATEEALELLGKALITPDQLRQQLMVGGAWKGRINCPHLCS